MIEKESKTDGDTNRCKTFLNMQSSSMMMMYYIRKSPRHREFCCSGIKNETKNSRYFCILTSKIVIFIQVYQFLMYFSVCLLWICVCVKQADERETEVKTEFIYLYVLLHTTHIDELCFNHWIKYWSMCNFFFMTHD